MGNVALAFIFEVGLTRSDNAHAKRQERLELKRIRSLVPWYLARLKNFDKSITTLNFNGLCIDTEILRMMGISLISGHTRVRELFLERNQIGPEGAMCIARILSKDQTLKNVTLAHNPVGSVGMISIASALEKNISLERLDLSCCNIGDNGIHTLSHAMKYNTTLRYLNIEGNNITSSGMNALLKCIYDTSSMQSLWESNHTLRAFFGSRIYSRSFPETPANRQLVRQMREIFLRCYSEEFCSSTAALSAPTSNLSHKMSARIAACKILRHYVKEEPNEYWECVEGMEEKLVPNIVGWLTCNGDVGVIYRVLKDMPWLLEKKAERNACQVLVPAVLDENQRKGTMLCLMEKGEKNYNLHEIVF